VVPEGAVGSKEKGKEGGKMTRYLPHLCRSTFGFTTGRFSGPPLALLLVEPSAEHPEVRLCGVGGSEKGGDEDELG